MRATMVLAALLVMGAPLQAQTASTSEPASGAEPATNVTLRPGDVVRVTVWRNAELSGEFPIAQDGTITHPLYRDLDVEGLTMPEVESRIQSLLATLESTPRFVVRPLLRVSVGGEVRSPSLYTLPPETSIGEAVALAGGATERGRLDDIRLFRGGREIRVDLTDPEAGIAQEPIRSGDQIFVERRTSIFRDYIAPAGSITAALVSLLSIYLNNN
ncbi:MAG TPA: polysaccharide biosynthesis/export family protein [Longimicrobiales bacterium]|nr:polysaccharide biosynthesis/export family protein [Longimicrobiales bacterium]